MDDEFKERTGAPLMGNIEDFSDFVDKELKEKGVSVKTAVKLRMAVDEIFSNICYYSGAKEVTLGVRVAENHGGKSRGVILSFTDDGIPYNPLKRDDPDVSLPLEKREKRGGLGVYLVKKRMDWVTYEYINGKNRLTLGLGENDEVE